MPPALPVEKRVIVRTGIILKWMVTYGFLWSEEDAPHKFFAPIQNLRYASGRELRSIDEPIVRADLRVRFFYFPDAPIEDADTPVAWSIRLLDIDLPAEFDKSVRAIERTVK